MTSGTERDGSRSVCCDPAKAPIRYLWYQKPGEPNLIARVKGICADAGMRDVDTERFIGEFRDRILLAQEGRLEPIRHVKGPMEGVTNIALYEIIWNFYFGDNEELHVRAYHVEPKDLYTPGGRRVVVGLHVHRKETEGDAVYEDQTREALEAGERYKSGRPTLWGLDTK
jgi:hypothetical protein